MRNGEAKSRLRRRPLQIFCGWLCRRTPLRSDIKNRSLSCICHLAQRNPEAYSPLQANMAGSLDTASSMGFAECNPVSALESVIDQETAP